MRRRGHLLLLLATLPACSQLFGLDQPQRRDGGDSTDAPNEMPCFGTLASVCLSLRPTDPVTLTGTLNTDTDGRCVDYKLPEDSNPVCVIAGTTIAVSGTVFAVGSRPLVLVALETIRVGVLDASSQRTGRDGAGARSANCDAPAGTRGTNKGAGGGGGAGNGTPGGAGGEGYSGMTGAAAGGLAGQVRPLGVVAGCTGGRGGNGALFDTGGGVGGLGGGALYLLAGSEIEVMGAIYASGAGGDGALGASGADNEAGGGGGGAGGLIALEAPTVIASGSLVANGGAGGGGSTANSGLPGADGATVQFQDAAQGGSGALADNGGGNGYAKGAAATNGGTSSRGGGGGGGGGGVVWIEAEDTQGGQMSSPPYQ